MMRPAPHIRYHIAAILAAHWIQFVAQYKRWIRPVVFENVRKVLACRTPVLGCHIYECKGCGHVELIPHSCKSRFCPTCGKHATDVWANQVLNGLLDLPAIARRWQALAGGCGLSSLDYGHPMAIAHRHHDESKSRAQPYYPSRH